MTQVSNSINVQPRRNISIVSIAPLIFGIMVLLSGILPLLNVEIAGINSPSLQLLLTGGAAALLSVWALIDIRGRFIAALVGFILGIIALLALFGYVSSVGRTATNAADSPHVSPVFWIGVIGAIGLILQLFFPRPRVTDVQIYGEEGLRDFMARMGVLGELLGFLWKRKLYWLIPMVLVLMVFIVLIVAGGNSAIAPFIYTLF
jgi:hypothetical protein